MSMLDAKVDYPTSDTAIHVCLHEHGENNKATIGAIGIVTNPLVVDIRSQPADPIELIKVDSLALAISALADISAIATSATELTAAEKKQLRAIFATRIRFLMTQV